MGLYADMARIMAEHPDLNILGFGVHSLRRMSAARQAAELAERRRELLEPAALAQFEKARAWLARQGRTCNISSSAGSSYGIRHVAENTIGYVANGVFIAAAYAEGFRVRHIETSPHAWLNISKASIISERRNHENASLEVSESQHASHHD
jgi:hypothetical protein